MVSIGVSIVLGAVLTVKKCRDRRYKFDHFYVIFYGMICYVISACFIISNHLGRCNFVSKWYVISSNYWKLKFRNVFIWIAFNIDLSVELLIFEVIFSRDNVKYGTFLLIYWQQLQSTLFYNDLWFYDLIILWSLLLM